MTDPNLSDVKMQNLLTEMTDILLTGEGDLDALLKQYSLSSGDMQEIVKLLNQLDKVLVPVQPSDRFAQRLHQDLLATDGTNVLVRVRRLPPRVQIAAGLALVAGFMFFSRRHFSSDARQEKQHKRAAAQ